MSKDKGILFTSESIQAILRGAKTQTRRVLSPQPPTRYHLWGTEVMDGRMPFTLTPRQGEKGEPIWIKLPYRVNDVIYIKETYATSIEGCPIIGDYQGVTYRADHLDPRGDGPANPIKWRPSMFMPKRLARIWLEVLDIRVERVQSISHEDAIAEGMPDIDKGSYGFPVRSYAVANYHLAWDVLNAGRGYPWESNPWDVALTFRRIER